MPNHKNKATKTWAEWTIKQRNHFLRDHKTEFKYTDFVALAVRDTFSQLPEDVQKSVTAHVGDEKYQGGGNLKNKKEEEVKFKMGDTVHAERFNKTGMVYKVEGNSVLIRSLDGFHKYGKKDLTLIEDMEKGGNIEDKFEVGTPVTYKDDAGEIVMRDGKKAISLYPNRNFGGSDRIVIFPKDWSLAKSFYQNHEKGGFVGNPLKFSEAEQMFQDTYVVSVPYELHNRNDANASIQKYVTEMSEKFGDVISATWSTKNVMTIVCKEGVYGVAPVSEAQYDKFWKEREMPDDGEFSQGGNIEESYEVEYYDKVGEHGGHSVGNSLDFEQQYKEALQVLSQEKKSKNLDQTWYIGVGGRGNKFAIIYINESYFKRMSEQDFKTKEAYDAWMEVAKKALATGKPQKGEYPEEMEAGGEVKKRYKVYKVGRKHGMSGRRELLGKNLTEEEARSIVNRYPDSNRSMVLYTSYEKGGKIPTRAFDVKYNTKEQLGKRGKLKGSMTMTLLANDRKAAIAAVKKEEGKEFGALINCKPSKMKPEWILEKGGNIPEATLGGFSLVYEVWSKTMGGNEIGGTIRTSPENYYVATISDDGQISFDDMETNTKELDKDVVREMWESGKIPKKQRRGIMEEGGFVNSGSETEIQTLEKEKLSIEHEIESLETRLTEVTEKINSLKAKQIVDDVQEAIHQIGQKGPLMPWQKDLTDEEVSFVIAAVNRYGSGEHPYIDFKNWTKLTFNYVKEVMSKLNANPEHLNESGLKVKDSVMKKFNVG